MMWLIRSIIYVDTFVGNTNLMFGLKYIVQAYLVTVRNKKRVCYTYELTIDVKGWYLLFTCTVYLLGNWFILWLDYHMTTFCR